MALTGAVDVPDTIVLRKTDLESKVTASGNFASLDPVIVGSNMMGGEVAGVFVEEGDKVYMGDVLARLKTSDIERSISDAQGTVTDLSRGDRQKLEAAQRAVNEASADYSAADRQTRSAVARAQAAYDSAVNSKTAMEQTLKDAQKKLDNANNALGEAEKELQDAETAPVPDSDVIAKKTVARDAAKASLEAAMAAREGAKAGLDQAAELPEKTREALDIAVEQRENSLRAAGVRLSEAQAQLDALYGTDSARQSRSQLESLNEELANASIVSPITGIVTKVMTEAGQTSTGNMFMIENTELLQISASVAEFDIIKIEEGMKAHVRSNATGSEAYEGIVDFVAPTAADMNGNFEVRVLLTSSTGQLKPGMTATVEIVIAAKKDIFAVPIDAVVTKPDGTKVVYVYEPGGMTAAPEAPASADGPKDGPVMIGGPNAIFGGDQREIAIKTGMETDFYIEIISDELGEGLLIVSDPMGRNVSPSGGGPMMIGGGPVGGPGMSEGQVTYVAD